MSDNDPLNTDVDALDNLPIQPTGNGVTDIEIAKLHGAVDLGAEDPSIETPIPNDEPTTTQF